MTEPSTVAPAPKNDICPAGFRAGSNDECVGKLLVCLWISMLKIVGERHSGITKRKTEATRF